MKIILWVSDDKILVGLGTNGHKSKITNVYLTQSAGTFISFPFSDFLCESGQGKLFHIIWNDRPNFWADVARVSVPQVTV